MTARNENIHEDKPIEDALFKKLRVFEKEEV